MKIRRILYLALCFFAASPYISHALPIYELIEIESLGGASTRAYALNDLGLVVGGSELLSADSQYRAFIWDRNTGTQNLGTLTGENNHSFLLDINNSGQAVGYSRIGGNISGGPTRAIMWDDVNGMRDLGLLPGHTRATAYGINDVGNIVGDSLIGAYGPSKRPLLWTAPGQYTELLIPSGSNGQANAINNSNAAVGTVDILEGGTRGYLWEGNEPPVDLGNHPNEPPPNEGGLHDTRATDINNNEYITGWSQGYGFIWHSDTGMIFLDEDSFFHPQGINDNEWIVGTAWFLINGIWRNHAALWNAEDGLIDLDILLDLDEEWTIYSAEDINNNGQVVFNAVNNTTRDIHAYLATPASIPEPMTFLLLSIGLAGIGFRYKRVNP